MNERTTVRVRSSPKPAAAAARRPDLREAEAQTDIAAQLDSARRLGHHLDAVAVATAPAVQTKLMVGPVGDRYEKEADHLADRVMRMPDPTVRKQTAPNEEEEESQGMQPLAAGITPLAQRQAARPEEDDETVQAKQVLPQPAGATEAGTPIEQRITSRRNSGMPLPPATRAFMESRFGAGFDRVRLHTDREADELNRGLAARAFTTGHDIFFRQGAYDPSDRAGQQLLAHELTHVLQQNGPTIRRDVQVENIDYNPETNEYRQGHIRTDEFFDTLRARLQGDETFKLYRNQLQNVIGAIRDQDFVRPDIDQLAGAIADAVIAQYGQRGMPAIGTLRAALIRHVTSALVGNIAPDYSVAMDKDEETAFNQMQTIVGAANMSRRKGIPTNIAYASLPANVNAGLNTVLQDIRDENARWTVAALTTSQSLPVILGGEVSARQKGKRYQGNHTNNAGWLPAVPIPASPLVAMFDRIYAAAGGGLKTRMTHARVLERLGLAGQGVGLPNPYRAEYEGLLGAEKAGLGDANLRRSVWVALTQGVSGYIEFSMPGGISRLVYDPINNRVFLSAHYKWKEGYNPWFHVTGFPPL